MNVVIIMTHYDVVGGWVMGIFCYVKNHMTHYDVVGGWVMGLCKKPAWGRKFPPLASPDLRNCFKALIIAVFLLLAIVKPA